MANDPFSCAMGYSSTNFYLILNATVYHNKLILYNNLNFLGHLYIYESACYSLIGKSGLFANHPVLTFNFKDISSIFLRKYTHLDKIIDFYTDDGFSLSLLLENRNEFIKLLPRLEVYDHTSANIFLDEWVLGKISSYEYLLKLNAISSRSLHDLSQYFVFPFILPAPHQIRDLTKSMGTQTEDRVKRCHQFYSETQDQYQFGVHYSNPATVLHFLFRVEPFTLFFTQIHNGFDHKDRLFCDIELCWKSAAESIQLDIKELLPQFFASHYFLTNINKLPLTERSDGHPLADVVLPEGVKTPIQYIWTMRKTLESNDVKLKLNAWIDLIWGYQSRGPNAIEALNLFHPSAYTLISREYSDPKIVLDQMNNFGQCPTQLFNSPHPPPTKSQKVFSDFKTIELLPLQQAQYYYFTNKSIAIHNGVNNFFSGDISCCINDYTLFLGERKFHLVNLIDVVHCFSTGYFATFSMKHGFIQHIRTKYDSSLTLAYCYLPNFEIKFSISSPRLGLCFSVASDKIALSEFSSGFFIKSIPSPYEFFSAAFDENTSLIICLSQSKLCFFSISLELVLESSPVSAVTFPNIYSFPPYLYAGNFDGSLSILFYDLSTLSLSNKILHQLHRSKIISVININDEGIVTIDSEGKLFLASSPNPSSQLLDAKHYGKCFNCENLHQYFCSICHLPFCANCKGSILAKKVCSACKALITTP